MSVRVKRLFCERCGAWRFVSNHNRPAETFKCISCSGALMRPSTARRRDLVSQGDYEQHKNGDHHPDWKKGETPPWT